MLGIPLLALLACAGPGNEAGDAASPVWSLEVVWQVGGALAEGPAAFGDLRGLAVDVAGRAWVIDAQAQEVRVFAADGAYHHTLGGKGGGPGEFEGLYGIAIAPDQRIWTADTRNQRYTVFDADGRLLATHRRPSTCFRTSGWEGTVARDGTVRDVTCGMVQGETRFFMARFDTLAGTYRDTITAPAVAEATRTEPFMVTDARGRPQALASVPFSPTHQWSLSPDGTVWFGWSGAYRLIQRSWPGDTLRVIARDVPRAPVSPAERDAQLAQLAWLEEMGGTIDASRVPTHHVAFDRFGTGDRGGLWVTRRAGDGSYVLDSFTREGAWERTILIPAEVSVSSPSAIVIRGFDLWLTGRDSLDASVLTRARIVREER